MKRTGIALALVFCFGALIPGPALADHDLTCHPPDPPRGGGDFFIADSFSFGVEKAMKREGFHLQLILQRGRINRGVLGLPDGRLFLGQQGSAQAACADLDGNGVAGLTSLELLMSDSRTGESVLVTITPADGEIDRRGWAPVTVVVENITFPARGMVR